MDYITIKQSRNIEKHIQTIMAQYDLTRYINRIPAYFKFNWDYLEYTDWSLIKELKGMLNGSHGKPEEREVANKIDVIFKGIGPKQSRNFLQTLGLTKYEVPIDSRITAWLNEFGFPIQLTASSLQDLAFYELVLDGFQELCAKASVYPCILDAAIFSSFDKGQWTQQNSIY